jgi:hypothetical protein
MTSNITYLLGAGASAGAIPPVNGMKQRMQDLAVKLNDYVPPAIHETGFRTFPNKLQFDINSIRQIIEDFTWLLKEGEHHITFDTLAKRFYFQGDIVSLNRLKRAHIFYFTIIQICGLAHPSITNTLVDKRYDKFIATVGQNNNGVFRLRGNIKVLTWNYDLQFELSLKRYVNQKVNEIKENFRIFPNHNSFELPNGNLINHNEFGILKLNGNAFFDNPSTTVGETFKTTLFDQFFDNKNKAEFLGELAYQYKWLHVNNNQLMTEAIRYFNFAWESNDEFQDKYDGHQNNLNEAIKIADNTDILVIIGYSFPDFNREVDAKLFENMQNLTKVYIQDINPQKVKSTIIKNFELFQQPVYIGNSEIDFQLEGKDSLDEFAIPAELWKA